MVDDPVANSNLPDALLTPLDKNNGVGDWLRYDPVYVKIRDARREEDDGMHRENWEAELKHANWQEVERLCIDVLQEKSKDLQIMVWLLEARLHLYGPASFSQDTKVTLAFIKAFWQDIHPQKAEDPTQEFRTHIIEAFLRSACDIVLLKPINELSPFFSQPPSLARCYEADNLEKTAKRGGAAADAYQKSLANGLISMDRIRNALAEVTKERGATRVAELDGCTQNLRAIEDFVNQDIGSEGPKFDGLINHFDELKGLYNLCQKVVSKEVISENISGPGLAAAEESPETHNETDQGSQVINDRSGVYQAVRQLSEYLLTIEPHSPSPALLELIGSWENKTLSQILLELQSTKPETKSLLDLLARAAHQERSQQAPMPSPPFGSTDISQLSNLAQ